MHEDGSKRMHSEGGGNDDDCHKGLHSGVYLIFLIYDQMITQIYAELYNRNLAEITNL